MRGFLNPDGVRLGGLAEFLEKSRNLTRYGWILWVWSAGSGRVFPNENPP